jgi:low affinity Fe/Cu permease
VSKLFSGMATYFANQSGRPVTFLVSVLVIIAWALTGRIFSYSESWHLLINRGTIVTFLIVFIIQEYSET